MNFQSSRALRIKSSPSMAVSLAARRMQAAGESVIDLSLGEPDFDTPPHIIAAAYDAMRSGLTRYTGPSGSEALRAAIVAKFSRENGLDYAMDEIAVANGAKQILFSAFLATLEPGDEVIVPAPYWVSYTDLVTLHGGVPRLVACGVEADFKLSPATLEAAIGRSTRWLLLNSPSNPSGAIYSRDEYVALGEVLARHPHVLVMSDEIYEHILLGEAPFISFAAACPELRHRTLVVNGVSKAYAMTGWRLGYAAGPQPLIAALNKMQSQSTTCPSSISQAAATAALNGPQDFVAEAAAEYRARGLQVVADLERIGGIELRAPAGAFYVFPKCTGCIGRRTPDGQIIENDGALATYLLEHGKVATVPGAAFGLEPYIRLSFAASREDLSIALIRVAEALDALI
jgi:aspartate aminotransferase